MHRCDELLAWSLCLLSSIRWCCRRKSIRSLGNHKLCICTCQAWCLPTWPPWMHRMSPGCLQCRQKVARSLAAHRAGSTLPSRSYCHWIDHCEGCVWRAHLILFLDMAKGKSMISITDLLDFSVSLTICLLFSTIFCWGASCCCFVLFCICWIAARQENVLWMILRFGPVLEFPSTCRLYIFTDANFLNTKNNLNKHTGYFFYIASGFTNNRWGRERREEKGRIRYIWGRAPPPPPNPKLI